MKKLVAFFLVCINALGFSLNTPHRETVHLEEQNIREQMAALQAANQRIF